MNKNSKLKRKLYVGKQSKLDEVSDLFSDLVKSDGKGSIQIEWGTFYLLIANFLLHKI